jgi:hypothetical protein
VVDPYEQGLTRAQIAAEFGCSEVTVRMRLHEAGIRTFADGATYADITRRRAEGQAFYAIAVAVGMCESAVRRLTAERRRVAAARAAVAASPKHKRRARCRAAPA